MAHDIWDIISRTLRGTANANDGVLLQRWLNADVANRELFEEVKHSWELTAKVKYRMDVDIDTEWNSFEAIVLNNASAEKNSIVMSKIRHLSMLIKIAAIVVFGMFSSLIIYFALGKSTETIILTSTNGDTQYILPDSTVVLLKKGSEIAYQNDFNLNNRNIQFKGDAFFKVKRNTALPFIIKGSKINVKVLGTSFKIKDIANDSLASVAVVTGRVSVHSANGLHQVLLEQDDSTTYYSNSDLFSTENNTKQKINLRFSNQRLNDIVPILEKHYQIKIELTEPIRNCLFTGDLNELKLQSAIDILSTTLGLTVSHVGEKVYFSGKGCNLDK